MCPTDKSSRLARLEPSRADSPQLVARKRSAADRLVTFIWWLSILLIVAATLIILRSAPLEPALEALKRWLATLGMWGPVVLALVYVVATILLVPGTILTLASGALFGLVVGTMTVSVGSTVGAALAFLMARYLARDRITAMAQRYRRFAAVDQAIGEGGWRVVALLRLSPAIPFNLQNYLYGLTRIPFWPCIVTSWLAMLPGTFMYVYLGHVTSAAVAADRPRGAGEWTLLAIGLLATVAATVYITRLSRRKLQEQIAAADQDQRVRRSAPSVLATALVSVVALVMVLLAAYVLANPQTIQRWIGGTAGLCPKIRDGSGARWRSTPGTQGVAILGARWRSTPGTQVARPRHPIREMSEPNEDGREE